MVYGRKMGDHLEMVEGSEEVALGVMRDALIDFSLDTGNRVLFERMRGSNWRSELTGGVETPVAVRSSDRSERDYSEHLEMQLLNAFLGEVAYYYKDDVIYDH